MSDAPLCCQCEFPDPDTFELNGDEELAYLLCHFCMSAGKPAGYVPIAWKGVQYIPGETF